LGSSEFVIILADPKRFGGKVFDVVAVVCHNLIQKSECSWS